MDLTISKDTNLFGADSECSLNRSRCHPRLHELGRHTQEPTLLLSLTLEIHLHSILASLLDDALLAGTGRDLALGFLVVEELEKGLS